MDLEPIELSFVYHYSYFLIGLKFNVAKRKQKWENDRNGPLCLQNMSK